MRRSEPIDRDPWEALIASDEVPAEFMDPFASSERLGKPITVVVGAVGGAGATLMACGLALSHAADGRPVAVAEFDFARGDIAGAWGVPPERTIDDLTSVIDELAPGHVEMVCHPHESGVWLLLAPRRPGAGGPWDEDATRLLLQSTSALGEVVVDAGACFGPHVHEACRQAHRIVVVTAPTMAGARRTRAILDALEQWGANGYRAIVANRGSGRDQLGTRAFASALGVTTTATLPVAPAEADEIQAGRWPSRRRRGGLAAAIQEIAEGRGTR
jgi:pilus assembly protein CpaE